MSTSPSSGTFGYPNAIRLFEELACSTWNWLADAKHLGLGFSEDTVSDLNMLQIARSQLHAVKVGRVTKGREHFVGFDWMWLVSAPGVGRVIYVVQAKKMRLDNAPSYAYGSLRYPRQPPFQIDALQAFAGSVGAVPLYCFYNNVSDSEATNHWHCRQQPDPPQMGCTLVPLYTVRTVHNGTGKRDFHRIHQYPCALPWRCLFHPKGSKFSFQRETDDAQMNTARNLDNGVGRDVAFDYLSGELSDDADTVDLDASILQLNLRGLVDSYSKGKFVPFPERLALLNLEG